MALIEEIKYYWNLRSSGFSDSVLNDISKGSDVLFGKISDYFAGQEVRDILDVGCGPGFFSMLFGSKGYNVTGIDYSDKMVEEARRNAEAKGVDAKFFIMDAQNMDFPDSSFDLVLSRDMFWCLERPEAAYREILRVLRPGGMAIVSDGNYYLHLYNKDYAEAKETLRSMFDNKDVEAGHEYFNKDKVDFGIIENLAKEMPLSHEVRPMWDVGTLAAIGCDDVSIHIRHAYPKGDSRLVMSFDIIIHKGD